MDKTLQQRVSDCWVIDIGPSATDPKPTELMTDDFHLPLIFRNRRQAVSKLTHARKYWQDKTAGRVIRAKVSITAWPEADMK